VREKGPTSTATAQPGVWDIQVRNYRARINRAAPFAHGREAAAGIVSARAIRK
jgi:hypothetical protein